MNRSIVGVGVGVLVLATALMVSPIALDGTESLTPLAELGVFGLPVALLAVLLGAIAPDPSITTIGGVFGNPVENEVPPHRETPASSGGARARGSPRRPVNCRQCYTLVPWDTILCPRCGRPRECLACAGGLDWSGSHIRCVRCGRVEVYCNCRKEHHAYAAHRPPGRRV